MSAKQQRIYVDFLKTDGSGRLLLSSLGTREDLERYGITLNEGLLLQLYTDDADDEGNRDDLVIEGIAHFDEANNRWVAIIDRDAIRHKSELDHQ